MKICHINNLNLKKEKKLSKDPTSIKIINYTYFEMKFKLTLLKQKLLYLYGLYNQ